MTGPAPALPDDPHSGRVGHLLLVDRDRDEWWRVHFDGTRELVGNARAAEALVRSWIAWRHATAVGPCGSTLYVPPEYVGDRYTVRFLADPAELDQWPDVTPQRVLR